MLVWTLDPVGGGGEKEGESLNITYVANRRTLLECGDCYQS